MTKATESQIEALTSLGITPPPTKEGCANILNFLFKYRWSDWNRAQKIAQFKAMEAKWLNKKVVCSYMSIADPASGQPLEIIGTVDYLVCFNLTEIRRNLKGGWNVSPFRVHIVPEKGVKVGNLFHVSKVREYVETSS